METVVNSRGKSLSVPYYSFLLGTPCQPDFRGAILMFEDVDEYIYRIDRMLAHLWLAGVFDQLVGVVAGQFTDCKPDEGYGRTSLDDVFEDYFKSMSISVFSGSQFGHIRKKFTVPIGLEAEMDADARTTTMLQAAVVG